MIDKDRLTDPFPRSAIKQRQAGGGRMLDYVEGHTVIHRLNDATDNCWDMEVKDITSKDVGGSTLMIARVALTIPSLGTREALGVQLVHERAGEDLVKGCLTDALKKAATLFGVGLELYGPDYEAGEVAAQARPAPAGNGGRVQRMPPTPAPRLGANPPPHPSAEPDMANPGQVNAITSLWQRIGIQEQTLPDFLMDHWAQERPEALTREQAGEAIVSLENERIARLAQQQRA